MTSLRAAFRSGQGRSRSLAFALIASGWILCGVTASLTADDRRRPDPESAASERGTDKRDEVKLKNGKSLRGRVVLELEDRILLQVGSRERSIKREDIESIRSVRRSMTSMLDALRRQSDASATWLAELAEDASKNGLEHEARLLHWRAILTDPSHAASHEALGHRQKNDAWRLKVGRSWKTLEEAGKIHANWGKAWEFRSEHFAIRCDSGAERCVDTLLELEFCYASFLDLFQRALELREIVEPMQVYVYRDRKRFPALSNNVSAFFAGDENILYTYVAGRSRPTALFHEATHAILHNSTARAARGRGSLPAWLNEGWADFMEGVVIPLGDGRCRLDAGRRLAARIRTLQGDSKPYGLQRLLNFKLDDYGASTRQAMKYAQGYALFVHMLESEAFLERFVEYLREAIQGKGQASTFRKMFRRELDAIEQEHLSVR